MGTAASSTAISRSSWAPEKIPRVATLEEMSHLIGENTVDTQFFPGPMIGSKSRMRSLSLNLTPAFAGQFGQSIALVTVLAGLCCLNLCSASAETQAHQPLCTYHYARQFIAINGHKVTVESYRPNGIGPFPLVFMLHGSAGAFSVTTANELAVDNFGEKTLARNCFAVVLPHYLEAVGRTSMTSLQEISSEFPELLAAVDVLLTDAEQFRWMKGRPIFLFGESLGGYLALALAFRRNEVAAISEFSAGMPPGTTYSRDSVPWVLISHGDADTLVPASEAVSLDRYCADHGIPTDIMLYSGEGHYLSKMARQRILSQTIKFFESH